MQQRIPTNQTKEPNPISINYKNILGKGTCGTVYTGHINDDPNLYAIKVIKTMHGTVVKSAKNEIEILKILTDPSAVNVVQLHGVHVHQHVHSYVFTIATTLAENGCLTNVIANNQAPSLVMRMQIMYGIINGLAYLHEKGILHCDIKPDNVLINVDMQPLLCDFGSAKQEGDDPCDISGTPFFFAPELLLTFYRINQNGYHTKKTDVYSAIFTLWCALTQTIAPFLTISTTDPHEFIDKVVSNNERENIPSYCPQHIAELITYGWDADPDQRPSAEYAKEILNLPMSEEAMQEFDRMESLKIQKWNYSVSEKDSNSVTPDSDNKPPAKKTKNLLYQITHFHPPSLIFLITKDEKKQKLRRGL